MPYVLAGAVTRHEVDSKSPLPTAYTKSSYLHLKRWSRRVSWRSDRASSDDSTTSSSTASTLPSSTTGSISHHSIDTDTVTGNRGPGQSPLTALDTDKSLLFTQEQESETANTGPPIEVSRDEEQGISLAGAPSTRFTSTATATPTATAPSHLAASLITPSNCHPGYRQSVFAELGSGRRTPPSRHTPSHSLPASLPSFITQLTSSSNSDSPSTHRHHSLHLPPLSLPDSSHASPLSSYNRAPLPGSPPGVPPPSPPPDLSLSRHRHRHRSFTMTSLASDRSRSSRRSDQPQMDTSEDAQVSAQIRNIANLIVSPVPQRRIHVMDDQQQHRQQHNSHHSLSPRSSSLGVPQQQRTHQQQQQQQQQQQHHQQMLHEDLSELTTEEMQERALSSGMTPNESTSDLYPAHSYQQQHQYDLQQPPLPPQKSFSTIDNQHSYDASPQHNPTTTSTQENAANTQSPPKPKLRNLDTSMTAARGKVSSFFGGISDSIAHVGGSHSSSSQNSASASTPTISSAYPSAQAIPPRQASPRDYGRYGNTQDHHQPQPSSSYPTTSHMQAPPPSSAPQTRSISQPLQHQQSIPQYAIPPSQHGQQASTSSTATGSSFNLLPRSSFYGLDNHLQPEGDPAQPQQQQQRWRGERRASPSSAISRPASQSIPRSETGHYTSPSLGGASSQGGHSGSGEPTSTTRRRVTSWTTRSNASSVYGLNMASPQLGPSSSGDLPPVPPVAPHLTQAHLRPGQGVSLLSHQKTLDMYRANVKKTNDPEVTFELAQFMLGLAREMAYQDMTLSASSAIMSPSTGGQGIVVPAPGGGMMMVMPNGNNHALSGVSEENLLSSLHDPDSSSPSPDPSFSFHSRSSGSSGDLASAALNASNRTFSNQGQNATGLQRRRGSLSPAPSLSNTTARLGALGMNRTGSPTAASAGGHGTSSGQANANDRKALVAEALSLLKRNADRGHVDSQYFLADIYANGGLEGGASSSRSASANGGGGGSARQSLYAHAKDLLPSLSSQGNSASAGGGAGSGNVSPLESMRMNPSPTGSAASLSNAQGYNPAYAGQSTTYPNHHQKPDFDKALPLFIAAAKHGHAPSAYRAGECLENGWGCRKDSNKAVQFYRKSAAASFPEAMYRLGMAELNGELGLKDRQKEGFKWLKQVAALAENSGNIDQNQNDPSSSGVSGGGLLGMNGFSSSSSSGGLAGYDEDGSNSNSANQNNHATRLCTVQALHELALLHERGIHNVVFVDNEYAAELLARASELGYAPSAYKLGECYEYGRMGCPQDAALSIHYYNIAAQQNHREACFALTAWYLVGSPGVLPQSDTEAYLWAKKAAEQGLAKAEYAVGYFTEVGIGCIKDERDAISWFTKAAEHGDKRAITRLRTLGVNPESIPITSPTSPRSVKTSAGGGGGGGGGKRGHRSSTASRDQLRSQDQARQSHSAHPDNGAANGTPLAGKEKRRSRRSTIPGIMGLTKEERPPMPGGGTAGQGGKKADGDCIVS